MERRIGNIFGFDGGNYAGNVYDKDGMCPTLNTMQGGCKQPMIVDHVKQMGNLSDTKSQSRTVYDSDGISPTFTSVQKDNLVMETVRIKQATAQGYIECEVGGVADLSFPDSKTRRGRVQERGQVAPTLMAGEQDICRIEPQLVGGIGEKWGDKQYRQGNRVYDSESVAMALTSQPLGNMGGNSYMYLTREPQYRIRKLTPREWWRLMDFTDEDFDKAAEVNSNTQLYKQAGNSIVKAVLMAIFSQMMEDKDGIHNK